MCCLSAQTRAAAAFFAVFIQKVVFKFFAASGSTFCVRTGLNDVVSAASELIMSATTAIVDPIPVVGGAFESIASVAGPLIDVS